MAVATIDRPDSVSSDAPLDDPLARRRAGFELVPEIAGQRPERTATHRVLRIGLVLMTVVVIIGVWSTIAVLAR